ncbi:interleukin-26 [Rhinatrema bivittatum]|uniref:interleukin-26 n=1 Tax=Rhinatrema bivittatum TaxID=194408 RepID=UPI00112E90A4|nr:interleukin-26 [Rhinatrema bivittatum]
MKSCNVRDQLLSFYLKDVFGTLKAETGTEHMVSGFAFMKENLRNCCLCASLSKEVNLIKKMKRTFHKLREKGVNKAISELDTLVLWIEAFVNTLK